MWQMVVLLCLVHGGDTPCTRMAEVTPVYHDTLEACELTLPAKFDEVTSYLEGVEDEGVYGVVCVILDEE